MKRRNFLSWGFLSIPAISFANVKNYIKHERPKKAIPIRANESRFDGVQTTVKDAIGRCVVSAADTMVNC